MKKLAFILLTLAASATIATIGLGSPALASDDNAQIKSLYQRFAQAFRSKDVDAMMSLYAPGSELLVFDFIPPGRYASAAAYRADWREFFGSFSGAPKFDLMDLSFTTDGRLGFGHNVQHVTGKMRRGKPLDITVRVTDVYRKIGGKWLIVHEHVSLKP